MPTTCRTFTAAEQEAERVRAAPVALTVWSADTPAGWINLLNRDGGYVLTGAGLRLFGQTDSFGPDVPIHAAGDDDAVSSAKTLIFSRWAEELDKMQAAFWAEVTCEHGPVDNGRHCPACQDRGFRPAGVAAELVAGFSEFADALEAGDVSKFKTTRVKREELVTQLGLDPAHCGWNYCELNPPCGKADCAECVPFATHSHDTGDPVG